MNFAIRSHPCAPPLKNRVLPQVQCLRGRDFKRQIWAKRGVFCPLSPHLTIFLQISDLLP